MKLKIVVAMLTATLSMSVFAGAFSFSSNTCGGNTACEAFFTQATTEINANLPDADAGTYPTGMANSAAMAGRGIGTDYANDIDFMMVSANLGVGIDTGDSSFSDFTSGDVDEEQLRGVGFQASATIGLDLGILPVDKVGPIDLEKMDIFFGFMGYDKGDQTDEVSAEISAMSFHARYHIMEGMGWGPLLKWGGLFVTTGLQKSNLKINYNKAINEQVTDSGLTGTFTGNATINAEVDTMSIPLEVSTYVQALYFLTIYTGLGMDYNLKSETTLSTGISNGSLTATGPGGPYTASGGSLNLGTSGEGDTTAFRGFLGIQIGVPLVKVYVQVNKQLSGDNVAQVAGGLKIVW